MSGENKKYLFYLVAAALLVLLVLTVYTMTKLVTCPRLSRAAPGVPSNSILLPGVNYLVCRAENSNRLAWLLPLVSFLAGGYVLLVPNHKKGSKIAFGLAVLAILGAYFYIVKIIPPTPPYLEMNTISVVITLIPWALFLSFKTTEKVLKNGK